MRDKDKTVSNENCYDIQIDMGDTIPTNYQIIAKDFKEANTIAEKLLENAKKYNYEDAELINVSLNHPVTNVEDLIGCWKADWEQAEASSQ